MFPHDKDRLVVLIVTGIVMLFFSCYIGVWYEYTKFIWWL